MQSKATTVAQYLAELPDDRRAMIEAVRQVIVKNIDPTFEEGMQYGMIGYYVPHSLFPAGYHCAPKQPLPFVNLASQKNFMSLYCMALYGSPAEEAKFREDYSKAGKKLDMGKSCIRFKRVEDLALDVIAKFLKRMTAKKYIAFYQAALEEMAANKAARSAAKKAVVKKAATKKAAKRTTG